MLLDPGSGCASPLSIDGVAFGVGTWSTSRFSTVQVGQAVLDRYNAGDAAPSRAPTPTDQALFTEAEDCVSLGENDWDVDAMVCDAAGLFDQGSVSPSATLPYTADKRLPTRPGFELNSVQSNVQGHVNENCEGAFNCAHGIELAKCAKCENARTKSQSA